MSKPIPHALQHLFRSLDQGFLDRRQQHLLCFLVRRELATIAQAQPRMATFPTAIAATFTTMVTCHATLLALLPTTSSAADVGPLRRAYHRYLAARLAVQRAVREREQWLLEYSYAVLDRVPSQRPEYAELHAQIAQPYAEQHRSWLAILSRVRKLDDALQSAERYLSVGA
jgi:hypothetical protein